MFIADIPPVPVDQCSLVYQEVRFQQPDAVWKDAFEHLIRIEGTEVAPPDASGGISKFGITKQAWGQYRGLKVVSDEKIKNLTLKDAELFYLRVYWQGMMVERIKSRTVAIVVIDQLINLGPFGGTIFLQRFISERKPAVVVSGIMLKSTIDEINNLDPEEFVIEFFKAAQRNYLRIAQKNSKQMRYLKGWLERTYRWIDLLKEED